MGSDISGAKRQSGRWVSNDEQQDSQKRITLSRITNPRIVRGARSAFAPCYILCGRNTSRNRALRWGSQASAQSWQITCASRLNMPRGTAPYYEVTEINVKDQAGYEKSGVDKVRDAIKTNGGKVIAGGKADQPELA
jgi:hypothetical protein